MKIDRTKEQPVKLTPTQMKQKIQSLEVQNEILLAGCYCHMCDKVKRFETVGREWAEEALRRQEAGLEINN